MMKYFFQYGFLALMFMSMNATANTVAVIDSRLAILNTKIAKQKLAVLEKSTSKKKARLVQIKEEISDLESAFTAANKTQSNIDKSTEKKQQLALQANKKLEEYNHLAQDIQRLTEDTQSDILTMLLPKLKQAVNEVTQKHQVDVLVEKKYIHYVTDQWNITQKVTQYIDAH